MIIIAPKLCKFLSWFIEIKAITLWPFIIASEPLDAFTENHEQIHLQQQKEWLVVGFWIIYIGSWLINLIKYRSLWNAYRFNVFEIEAYENEHNFVYLRYRRLYSTFRKHSY